MTASGGGTRWRLRLLVVRMVVVMMGSRRWMGLMVMRRKGEGGRWQRLSEEGRRGLDRGGRHDTASLTSQSAGAARQENRMTGSCGAAAATRLTVATAARRRLHQLRKLLALLGAAGSGRRLWRQRSTGGRPNEELVV